MKNKSLVSIIIVTYNHEKFIKQCLDSILEQTYPFLEAIIIDDGSTDKTTVIIERYNDNRIHLYKQKNKGIWRLDESYNKAFGLAKGELIAILEGDDFWPVDKLENQIQDFTNSDVVLSYGYAGITDAKGNLIRRFPKMLARNDFQKIAINSPNGEAIKQIAIENFIVPATVLIRKSSLKSIGGFKKGGDLPVVDIPTFLRLSMLGRFAYHPKIMGFWRQHFSQATKKITPTIFLGEYKILEEFFKEHPDLPKKLKIDLSDLKKIYERKIFDGYYVSGRAKLAAKNFGQAKIEFLKVIKSSQSRFPTRLKSLLGLGFSLLKIDLEGLAKILGKPSYK